MLHGVQASSAFHQLRSEGITFLYRGIFPPLAQKTVSLALMFGKWFLFFVERPEFLSERCDFFLVPQVNNRSISYVTCHFILLTCEFQGQFTNWTYFISTQCILTSDLKFRLFHTFKKRIDTSSKHLRWRFTSRE